MRHKTQQKIINILSFDQLTLFMYDRVHLLLYYHYKAPAGYKNSVYLAVRLYDMERGCTNRIISHKISVDVVDACA